jgi:acyl carrier protein
VTASVQSGAAAVLAELRAILVRVTGRTDLAEIAPETGLFGDGVWLDSLTGTLLLIEIRHRFGVDVAAEDLNLDCLATLATLVAFITERWPGDDERATGAQAQVGDRRR